MFSELIKESRIKAGITQLQAAEALGYKGNQFIQSWESGRSMPPVDKLDALSRMYKMDCRNLVAAYCDQKLAQLKAKILKEIHDNR